MPTFKVTSPSGKTVRITGDRAPTEQELNEIFSKIPEGGQTLPRTAPEDFPSLQEDRSGFLGKTAQKVKYAAQTPSITTGKTPLEKGKTLLKGGEYLSMATPAYPLVAGIRAYSDAVEAGASTKEAVKQGLKTGAIDAALYAALGGTPAVKVGGKQVIKSTPGAIDLVGKNMAKLYTFLKGTSQSATKYTLENPNIIIKPKKTWQKVYTEAYDSIKQLKSEIGSQVSILKREAAKAGKGTTFTKEEALTPLRKLLDDPFTSEEAIPLADAAGRRAIKKLIDILDERLGKTVDLQDIFGMAKEVGEVNIIKKARRAPDAVNAVTATERLLEGYGAYLTKVADDILDKIPDIGKETIKAKKDYSKLLKITKRLGNVTEDKMGSILEQSLATNNEGKFDVLKSILPKDIFDQAIGHIVNRPGKLNISLAHPEIFTAKALVGPASKLGAQVAGKAGGYSQGPVSDVLLRTPIKGAATLGAAKASEYITNPYKGL